MNQLEQTCKTIGISYEIIKAKDTFMLEDVIEKEYDTILRINKDYRQGHAEYYFYFKD